MDRRSAHRDDWRELLQRVAPRIDGYCAFVETRAGQFVRVEKATDSLDVVGLALAWVQEDVPPWEMEAPAKALLGQLSDVADIETMILLSRSVDSFAGYYVRVRSKA